MKKRLSNWLTLLKTNRRWFSFFSRNRRPFLVLVTDQWENCQNEIDRTICRKLRERNYYTTPDFFVGAVSVNVALVPYRLALVNRTNVDERKLTKYLSRKGWNVLFYNATEVESHQEKLLSHIESITEPTKNASLL
ncbi:hypothetical protein [Shouchella shacheensis]|uniref:hypothetical protein n=1 Tax=Shouchella shacheensis TaxID=1649580 RepID=UPI00074029A3|nr:hypothetical protein [Shouchella shacheensis]